MVVNKAKERMRLDVEALYKRDDENRSLFSIELRNNFDRGKLFIERETLVTDQKNQLKYST